VKVSHEYLPDVPESKPRPKYENLSLIKRRKKIEKFTFVGVKNLMYINRAIRRQAPITAASKIILNNWKLSGTSVIRAALAFGALM
jgi:hypothetical protein